MQLGSCFAYVELMPFQLQSQIFLYLFWKEQFDEKNAGVIRSQRVGYNSANGMYIAGEGAVNTSRLFYR